MRPGDPAAARRPAWAGVATCVVLIAICCLALGIRANLRYNGPYIFFGDERTGQPDADAITFNLHALNLVAGRGFGDYIKEFRSYNYVPPGHPFFMAFFYYFFGNNPPVIGWIVAIFGSLVCVFAYLWGREMFNRGVGLITALLVAVHPSYVRIGFSLMSEPTVIFLTAIALWLGARLVRRPGPGIATAAGLVFGFAGLARPSAFAFLIGLFPFVLLRRSVAWRRRAVAAAVFAAASMLLPAAWQVRNWIVHGEYPGFLYSSISARQAWMGANPKHMPYYYSRDTWHNMLWNDPHAAELQRIRRVQREQKEFVRANRLKHFFSCLWRMHVLAWLEPDRHDEHFVVRWKYGGYAVVGGVFLLVMGFLGAVRAVRVSTVRERNGEVDRVPGAVWVAAVSLGVIVAAVGAGYYGASDRYRWPIEYGFFPFAALGVYGLLHALRVDVAGWWTLVNRVGTSPPWLRRTRQALGGLLVVLVAWFLGGLVWARWHPDRSAEEAPVLSEGQVLEAIDKVGLTDFLAAQETRWITFDMVLEEQATNYGHIITYTNDVVAWWGRIAYPRYRAGGEVRSGYVILAPKAGDFGGVRLQFRTVPWEGYGLRDIKEGDIVTLIGQIDYERRSLARPDLLLYAAVPGRFEIPGPQGSNDRNTGSQ